MKLVLLTLAGLILGIGSGCVRAQRGSAAPRASVAAGRPALGPALAWETFQSAWDIIYRTHFDTNFNGINWLALRDELQPRAQDARSMEELREVIQEMLNRLGQSHFALLPREWVNTRDALTSAKDSGKSLASPQRAAGVPEKREDQPAMPVDRGGHPSFQFRLIQNEMIVTAVETNSTTPHPGPLRPGWAITRIDNMSVQELIQKADQAINNRLASLELWASLNALLQGPVGSTVDLEIENDQKAIVSISVLRARQPGEPVKLGNLPEIYSKLTSARLLAGSKTPVGYIQFNSWMFPLAQAFDRAMEELATTQGIVIDLRGNLGGAGGMIMGLSGHFLSNRVSLGTMRTRDSELNFFANPRLVNTRGERVEPFVGPLAILVDAVTYSASEVFAGGMQDIGRARIFGQKTVGGALPALFDRLPNGDVLLHAFADFITPSGKRLEGSGVVPDVEVPLRRKDISEGRDAALEAALNWISGRDE